MNKKTSIILLTVILAIVVLVVAGVLYFNNRTQLQGRPENNIAQPTVNGNALPVESATSTYPAEPKMIKPKISPWQPPAHTPNNS